MRPHSEAPVIADDAPLKILLVEDDDAVRGVIRRVLERLGHAVQCCASATEATSSTDLYQVALVDLNLGGGAEEGRGVVEYLRSERPEACYVIISGARPTLPGPDDGGPMFLEKPFSRGDLVRLLEAARAHLRGRHRVGTAESAPPAE